MSSDICADAYLADIGNVAGSCEYKCSLQLKYPNLSTLTFDRKGFTGSTNISFLPNNNSESVTYNGTSYSLQQARIFIKSCHNFNGSPVQGELVLQHKITNSSNENNTLFICVPIIEGSGQSILDDLLLRSKNLQDGAIPFTTSFATFIPRKPYYNYKSNPLFSPTLCDNKIYKNKANYVVFDKLHALTINKESIDYLTENENENTYSGKLDAYPAKEVFKSVGPPGDVGMEDIYIDCQPVGASGKTPEQEFVPKEEGLPTFFVDNKFVPIIVGMILMYYSYRLISYVMCKASINLFKPTTGPGAAGDGACESLLFGLPFT